MAVDISNNVHTDLSNKVYIKSPDPTTSLIFFVILTTLYMFGKYSTIKVGEYSEICNYDKTIFNTNNTLILTGGYILLLVIGNYFINLNVTKKICGNVQWKNTFLATLTPWVLIFGSINLLLIRYSGWLSPFSNTLGYLVAKMSGLNKTVDNILVSEKEAVSLGRPIYKIVEDIYSDKSLLINEIPKDTFCEFVYNMEMAKLFKEGRDSKDLVNLFNFILLKDIVAEYIWYMLSGILVTSVSYNYILNSSCKKNVKDMERRHDDYVAKKIAQHQNPKKERVYTLDEM